MGLAGRKERQKIGEDPRGNRWLKDPDTFGKKLLQKMGWREGTGLGTNGTGIIEHVVLENRVGFEAAGLGMHRVTAAEDTYRQLVVFENVLERLNSECTNIKTLKKKIKSNTCTNDASESGERKDSQKSVKSALRLSHRSKFIRNKSVSNYTEAELKSIIG